MGLGLLWLFAAFGCASRTSVNVEVRPDGTCIANYTSDKEQMGLEAAICGGNVKVDKSGTLESVVAAQSAIIQKLLATSPTPR
jgi:hypothetical protein